MPLAHGFDEWIGPNVSHDYNTAMLLKSNPQGKNLIPGYEQIPISTLDILPTIFEITGVKLPKDRTIDGRDICSLLMPETHKNKLDEFKFFYSYFDNQPSAIRKDSWMLHVRIDSQTKNNYGFTASREAPLLFQVEKDLGERIDVSKQYPEKVLNCVLI